MIFENTVNVGNLIMIALVSVSIVGGWYKFGGRLDIIEFRATAIEATLRSLGDALKSMAAHEKEMAIIEQRQLTAENTIASLMKEVGDLRRGDGWIQSQRRANVDGQYKRED